MPTITPINRHTEYVVEDDGTKAYKIYNNASPHYYMDKTGSLNPIDITNLQTITKASVGEIKLREKNVASIGLRTDGNKTKYLGMRPDETQEDGSQQFEWTIEEAIINNVTQSITLNQTSSINDITTNLGGQVVQSTRYYTRQMVPVTGSIDDFQVKYKLHLTGLQISNSKDTETNYYTSDNGYFKITDTDNNIKFLVPHPVLLDSDFEQVTNDTIHTLKDNGDNTYEYIKYPSDSLLSSGISGSVSYIDATTIYATATLDGVIDRDVAYSGNTFQAQHDEALGTAYSTDGQTDAVKVANTIFGINIHRTFFGFDTTAITVTPTSAELRITTYHPIGTPSADIIAIEATHTEIALSTFNDFTGWGAGWGSSDVTPYSAQWDDIADTQEENQIPLLTKGLLAIAMNDTTKICVMEHDYDYLDQTPAGAVWVGLYTTEASGTTLDPYLYIVEAPLTLGPLKIKGGKLSILGGKLTIK